MKRYDGAMSLAAHIEVNERVLEENKHELSVRLDSLEQVDGILFCRAKDRYVFHHYLGYWSGTFTTLSECIQQAGLWIESRKREDYDKENR